MKTVTFGNEARLKLKKGVDLIADSIKVTLGPRGRNVCYGFHYGSPVLTKDGVTVARQVECKDQTEQLGLMLIRQVAQKTADDAGDGTTTASLLAQAIFTEGIKVLGTGANPILIKRGIDEAVAEAIKFINKHTIKDASEGDLLKIASISANNDQELGKLICEAIKKAGKDGVITIEDNYKGSSTYVQTVEGMQLNQGYVSPYFATNPDKMEALYNNPYILIADYELTHIQPLMRAFELAMGEKSQKRPLVIIANDISGQALQTLIMNKHKGGVPILACKAPYFGDNRTEQLTDLAILTGGRVIGPTSGLTFDDFEISDFGQVDQILSTKSFTTFTGGKGKKEDVDARIKVLQGLIEATESDYEKAKLQERLAKLTSGVAVIKVGASTEVEVKEKKMRIEDALHATRAALEEGIVPGGGVMLLRASKHLSGMTSGEAEMGIGWKIVTKAMQEPIKQIALNSGLDGSEIMAFITADDDYRIGYDFLNNQLGNLIELGVIDPAKVVRMTLENASSVAGMLLTTEVCINETVEDEIVRTPRGRSE
jgi:chaperonin GroEL